MKRHRLKMRTWLTSAVAMATPLALASGASAMKASGCRQFQPGAPRARRRRPERSQLGPGRDHRCSCRRPDAHRAGARSRCTQPQPLSPLRTSARRQTRDLEGGGQTAALPSHVRIGRVHFGILGPLEVRDDDAVLTPAGGGLRALLAMLLLHANEAVSTDRLLDALWPDGPPPSGAAALQVRVSHLRKALGTAGRLVVTGPSGYRSRSGAASSTSTGSRSSSNVRMSPSLSMPPRSCGRRSGCGAGLRSRTSPTRNSRSRRSHGWKSCASRRLNAGSKPISS